MKLGVMQPYFFPYLGYYQLAASVDHFVFLDDVAFIRRGFIHRNQILLRGQPFRFTLPVANASQNRLINQHFFTDDIEIFMLQIEHAYHRAPFFHDIYALIESVCEQSRNVAQLCAASILAVFSYLQQPFSASFSSEIPSSLRGQSRILDLCARFDADTYHNASGGRELYDSQTFSDQGVLLRFVHGIFPSYPQLGVSQFVPGLSMIDVLMSNPPQAIVRMLSMAELENAA